MNENPEEIAALLRAYRKAQDWINKHPEEAVEIIISGKYAQIEDKELAIELIKSYEYPSFEDRASNKQSVESDVQYFVQALYDIGYLTSEPTQFAKDIFVKVDV